MSILTFRKAPDRKQPKHARGLVPAGRKPAPPDRTLPPGVIPAAPRPQALEETAPFPAPVPPRRPRRVRQPARPPRRWRPYIAGMPSPVRDAVLLTGHARIAASLRFGLACQCGREHFNAQADSFPALRVSAENAGWQQDPFGVWRCPRCARRHAAWFGVRPVAAIEAGGAA
jgi:hypothetical protein